MFLSSAESPLMASCRIKSEINNSLATDFECVNASAVIVRDKWLPDDKIPSSQLVNGEVLASNPPVIA